MYQSHCGLFILILIQFFKFVNANFAHFFSQILLSLHIKKFGHSLGLGHSSVQSAIMFPWYHGYEKHKQLPEDDRLAIQQIYGSREKMWGHNPVRPPITTKRPPTTTTTTPRSYYPDPSDKDREREWEERRREQERKNKEQERKNRDRQREIELELERQRQREEWQRQERNRLEREKQQREYEKRQKEWKQQQKEKEQRDKIDRERNERKKYDARTTQRPWYHHNHPSKHNNNGNNNNNNNNKKKDKPEACNTGYDAITLIRSELYIFKDRVSIDFIRHLF